MPKYVVRQIAYDVNETSNGRTCLGMGNARASLIARLAEKHLSPEAKAAIAAILEPNESLADPSLWADKVRNRMLRTAHGTIRRHSGC